MHPDSYIVGSIARGQRYPYLLVLSLVGHSREATMLMPREEFPEYTTTRNRLVTGSIYEDVRTWLASVPKDQAAMVLIDPFPPDADLMRRLSRLTHQRTSFQAPTCAMLSPSAVEKPTPELESIADVTLRATTGAISAGAAEFDRRKARAAGMS